MSSRSLYLGIFLLSCAIITFELSITRLLSVTLYYHLAFLVISIVMLGLSLGAMLIYCWKDKFPQEKVASLLSKYSLYFAVLAPLSTVVHVLMPLELSARVLYAACILVTCALLCASVICAGVCTCLVLTRFPEKTGRLYAADLAGAAFGCYVFVLTLGPLDGVSETFLVGALGCLAAFFFAAKGSAPDKWSAGGTAVFLTAAIVNSYCVGTLNSGLRINWMHGTYTGIPMLEKWSPIGRITVSKDSDQLMGYRTLGYSEIGPQAMVRGLNIDIDGSARTVMLQYNGKPADFRFLQHDLVYFAHHLRRNADVLIIGSGGGKDVVAALSFDQAKVKGVELNGNTLSVVNKKYADFTGHLNEIKNVSFVNDEGRHFVSTSPDKYDIIMMSLIDTWAATSSGAFILSENCLYTVEAWTDFLRHLKPHGIYTVSRWYRGEPPAEMLRTVSLAGAALKALNISNPEKHLILVKNGKGEVATGTLMVSPDEFSDDDVNRVKEVCRQMKFECILAPGMPHSQAFSDVINQTENLHDSTLNFAASTDDSPFFFNMVKLSGLSSIMNKDVIDANWQAVLILFGAVVLAVYGSFLLTVMPLRISKEKIDRRAVELGFYFFGIGLGFMFVEISQIQKLIVVLGHPTYGITCVLFTLLLMGGMGSLSTKYLLKTEASARALIFALIIALLLFGIFANQIFPLLHNASTFERIGLAALILAVPGFCMGFAFPLGMRFVNEDKESLAPWFWGLNGAGSVCGSVIALFISMNAGITSLFWTGFACYCISLVSYLLLSRKQVTVDNFAANDATSK